MQRGRGRLVDRGAKYLTASQREQAKMPLRGGIVLSSLALPQSIRANHSDASGFFLVPKLPDLYRTTQHVNLRIVCQSTQR